VSYRRDLYRTNGLLGLTTALSGLSPAKGTIFDSARIKPKLLYIRDKTSQSKRPMKRGSVGGKN
jgi:hypothetical protein